MVVFSAAVWWYIVSVGTKHYTTKLNQSQVKGGILFGNVL